MRHIRYLYFVFFLFSLILSGCESVPKGGGDVLKPLGKNEEGIIKAVVWNEQMFNQRYGNLFTIQYPQIELQLVSAAALGRTGKNFNEEFSELIDTEQPDIILFPNADLFEIWASEGKLQELDPLIQASKFDVDSMDPNALDYLKARGNGRLFGLSPTFNSKVLYYNKDLFQKYSIDFPRNGMSWEEVMQLAARFPVEGDEQTRIYGYYPALNSAFVDMISSDQLAYLDAEGVNATFNTPELKRMSEMILDGYRNGYLYQKSETSDSAGRSSGDIYTSNLFTMGRAAMSIRDAGYINEMNSAGQVAKIEVPNWDIVTMPVSPAAPEETDEFMVNDVLTIYAASTNQRAAWQFMQYINSDEAAKSISKLDEGLLMLRAEYSQERDGRSLEPFYMLKPAATNLSNIPYTVYLQLVQLMESEMNEVLKGGQTLEQALEHLQQKGQTELERQVPSST
ncbi:ABC transporter substrate-binding protein [Paenibacillus eucommiae]|uniref:Multiple sugar transport system substrate-binding protein n=1 Tax=Paenibacillus eucommiae TaxID=1355755 RepID=A0ABS4IST6_9BACL|nr:extracellular solute-binding protein [Paenibacillus eucommiae]MBP1990583.1 multiple sugar transport system substrate-binding protein [Paenibacillus eucommiae]